MRPAHIILGVPQDATPEQVKTAYRRLARQCHPDLCPGDRLAAARFRSIQSAYEHYQALWAGKNPPAPSGASEPSGRVHPEVLQIIAETDALARPFLDGVIGVGAEFLKRLVGKMPQGPLTEIAGKAGQAAIDAAAAKARQKLHNVGKKG